MRKHVELSKETIDSVMKWKNRERKPSLLDTVRAALESATRQNGHVSFVERLPVALIKNFYTLWDGEIVGNLYISFRDESVTFLHNNAQYQFFWEDNMNGISKWKLQAMIEAYALGYDEFEKLILPSANAIDEPKDVAYIE